MPFDNMSDGRFKPTPGPLDPRFDPTATIAESPAIPVGKMKAINLVITPSSKAINFQISSSKAINLGIV